LKWIRLILSCVDYPDSHAPDAVMAAVLGGLPSAWLYALIRGWASVDRGGANEWAVEVIRKINEDWRI